MNAREKILVAGLGLLERHGPAGVTRDAVADIASVTPSLVSHHYGSIGQFKDLLMQVAVDRAIPKAIAWGMLCNHPVALAAPQDLKHAAIVSLGKGG